MKYLPSLFIALLLAPLPAALAQNCNARFTFAVSGCNTVSFTPDTGNTGIRYHWNFGDGLTSTEKMPSHTFLVKKNGSHTFKVTLITSGNCIPDTLTQTVALTIPTLPEPGITSEGLDPAFVNCGATSQNPDYRLTIVDTSKTTSINQFFTIDWGDGSPVFEGATIPKGTSHLYRTIGLFNILVRIRDSNGCIQQDTFDFFNGDNPGGNLGNIPNTSNCIPASVTWPIQNTEFNAPGTRYRIWVNDGTSDTVMYNHPPRPTYSHLFEKSSCDPEFPSNKGKFDITFEASNPCQTRLVPVQVTMHLPPDAKFSIAPDKVNCVGTTIAFKNISRKARYFSGNMCRDSMKTAWEIIPKSGFSVVSGSLTSNEGFSAKFDLPGTYQIILIYDVAFNSIACLRDTMVQTICVLPVPKGSFTKSARSGCAPMVGTFTNTSNTLGSCGPVTYEWAVGFASSSCGADKNFEFIAPTSASTPNAQIRFNAPGDYVLSLKVTNKCGTNTFTDTVTVAGAVLSAIEPIPDSCGSVTFKPGIQSTNFCPNAPPTYIWTFPAPHADTFIGAEPPVQRYSQPGTYVVSLRTQGCTNTLTSDTFTVSAPLSLPRISVNSPCPGSDLVFSHPDTLGLTCTWTGPLSFRSTECAPILPKISPQQAGEYCVTVKNQNGCTQKQCIPVNLLASPLIKVAQDTTHICIGQSATLSATGGQTYTWTPTATMLPPSGAGDTVRVTPPVGIWPFVVNGANGINCSAKDTAVVIVHALPTAAIVRPDTACTGVPLPLEGRGSTTGGTGAWTTVLPALISNTGVFSSETKGKFPVTYFYTSKFGCKAPPTTDTVCVLQSPQAVFSASAVQGCAPFEVGFANTSSTRDECFAPSYTWSVAFNGAECPGSPGRWGFASGNATSFQPIIRFEDPGEYEVALRVTNACGTRSTKQVIRVGAAPQVAIEAIKDACSSTTLTPKAVIKSCNAPIHRYAWTFSGGIPAASSAASPDPVTFPSPGPQVVELTVANACGTAVANDTFVVYEGPTVSFQLEKDSACVNAVVQTTNTSSGIGLGYRWSAKGPGRVVFSNTTVAQPTLTFPDSGRYVITLAIRNPGCDTIRISDTILIREPPTVALAPIPDACGQARFTPKATYSTLARIDSVRWSFPAETGAETGSGFFPSEQVIEKTGTYSVKVRVSNRCGEAEAARSFSVLQPIVVSAQLSADTTCGLPARIQVTNTSKGDKLNVKWAVFGEFADRVVFAAALPNPEMTFRDTGVYILQQEVFNDVCGSLTWRDTVTILTVPIPILQGQDRFCEKVSLTPQIDYLKYRVDSVRWDFIGGTPAFSTERKPVGISYGKGGEYRYTMQAFNYCGSTVVSDTIYLDEVPVLNVGPTDTICMNEGPFTLPAAQPTGGTWLDALGRPGVVSRLGVLDPVRAGGGVSKIRYEYAAGACTASASKEVYVVDLSNVDAGPDRNTCISDSLVFLKGGMPRGGWYRGPGVTDTLAGQFSPRLLAEGSYTLTYTYRVQGTKCIQSDPFRVYVRPLPKPAVHIADSICVNVPLILDDRSTGGATYRWQVSQQAVYEQQNPRHTFTDTGYHQIRLLVGSLYGCLDSLQTEVYASRPPLTAFEKDTSMGCAILPVRLTNKTTGDHSVRYTWDFGNGDPLSAQEQPGTVYYPQGTQDTTYHIRLSAGNYCGTDVAVDSVRVLAKPLVDLRINQRFACTPSRVVFNNLSKGLPRRYEWYIEGTLFSEDSIAPAQVLRATGPGNSLYTIALVAHNDCGSDTATQQVTVKPDSIRAFFETDLTEGCEPLKVGFKNSTSADAWVVYNWSFQQDGHTSNAKDTAFTFFAKKDTVTRYTVSLLANNGCSENSFSTHITVFPAPKVALLGQDSTCLGAEVHFSSPTPALSGYLWEFGDGNTSKETFPRHRYGAAGGYRVKLTAYSARNACPGIDSQNVYIRALPTPVAEVGPLSGCPPHRITPQNKTPDAGTYYYAWDFGDGRSVVGQDPGGHTYSKTGQYTVSLRAVDRFGCANDTVAGTVRVFPEPEAQFAPAPLVSCGIPQQVCMQNLSKGADAYLWDFGNNTLPSDLQAPCATYAREGSYRVRLVVRNHFLCSDTLEKPFVAYEKPQARAELFPRTACAEGRFQIFNLSRHAEWAEWVIPGGITDTAWSPLLRIAQPGGYSVTLVVGNSSGCRDTLFLSDYLRVFPTPRAGIRVEKDPVAPPSTYWFKDDSSPDATRYGWDLSEGLFSSQKDVVQRYVSRFDREIRHWVSNEQGCADTARYQLDLDTLGGLFVPNTLEPGNQRSEKQWFTPKGIGLGSWHIALYTRGGQLIWESTELDKEGSPVQSWDGTFLGEEMPAGVYVWKVHYARFIDGSYWGGMPDEKGRPQRTGILYLLR